MIFNKIVLLAVISCVPSLLSGSKNLAKYLQVQIEGEVHKKGTWGYEKRRLVHNGLCDHIYPDLIAVPKSTEDVAAIVKFANKYKIPISVRSGGHSFTCTSTRQGGIHFDLRKMNKIALASPHLAILGSGSTWQNVLDEIPIKEYSMIHGQCLSVGVGGYILGGGVNVVGTSERFGSAATNVKRYTMVDARGRILLVSDGNTTVIEPYTGKVMYKLEDDFGLFEAMRGAGSSFGIVTEFLYKIYPRPETQPIVAMIYLEDSYDLRKLEKASKDGRYHLTWFVPYIFRPITFAIELLHPIFGIKLIPKILRLISFKNVEPILVQLVDNSPYAGLYTDRHEAMEFLKEFGIKLAKDGVLAHALPNMLNLLDYESQYMTTEEIRARGFQGVASANLLNLSSQHLLDDFIFNHPVFGLKHKESEEAKRAGCDFCYLIVPSTNRKESILPLTDMGRFQVELTCTFSPHSGSACPQVLKNVKEIFRREAMKQGDKPKQYLNTPSCDKSSRFGERYFDEGVYERLLQAKHFWDPKNVFNHCQSIGSTNEDCCPAR